MSIKFLVLGGGIWVFIWGGGGVPILFLWTRGIFLKIRLDTTLRRLLRLLNFPQLSQISSDTLHIARCL